MRHAGARGGRRVEVAHVVADLVGPQLRELGARADAGRAVLAGQRPAGAAREGEVQQLERAAGKRPGALAARRRCQAARGRHAGASPSRTATDSGVDRPT